MLFSVGYPVINVPWFARVVKRYKEHIGEIYFSWKHIASGRMRAETQIQEKMEKDLAYFHDCGINLSLLFNANCYGKDAVSSNFAQQIINTVNEIKEICGGLESVTTTSPFVAYIVKRNRPDIQVKASVNMRIGTVEGMMYLKDYFDGFYVQREYNRDIRYLKQLKSWADKNGKELFLLLNSGCLNFCSNQTFHDNLVAHEGEIAHTPTQHGFNPVICHNFYANAENRKNFYYYSNWIHPDNLVQYEDIIRIGKLATRMTTDIEKVLAAYTQNKFNGDIFELLEPNFQRFIAPFLHSPDTQK